jgi:hypothetical protein
MAARACMTAAICGVQREAERRHVRIISGALPKGKAIAVPDL